MTYTDISVPVIAWDTRNQMQEVVQSIRDGKLEDTLVELAAVKDDKGESVCVYSMIGPVVFGDSEHIGNRNVGSFVLWSEVVGEGPA